MSYSLEFTSGLSVLNRDIQVHLVSRSIDHANTVQVDQFYNDQYPIDDAEIDLNSIFEFPILKTSESLNFHDSPIPKSVILVDGGIHPREIAGIELSNALLDYMNNCDDALCEHILDTVDLLILPVVNVDAHEEFGEGRKNKRVTCVSKDPSSIEQGVDINRNFPYKFKFTDGCDSEEASGTKALSEPESRALDRLAHIYNIQAAVHLHTFGDMWINPFNCCPDMLPKESDLALYKSLADVIGPKYKYGNVSSLLNYTTSGEVDDYFYDRFGIFSISIEMGANEAINTSEATRKQSIEEYLPLLLKYIFINQSFAFVVQKDATECKVKNISWVKTLPKEFNGHVNLNNKFKEDSGFNISFDDEISFSCPEENFEVILSGGGVNVLDGKEVCLKATVNSSLSFFLLDRDCGRKESDNKDLKSEGNTDTENLQLESQGDISKQNYEILPTLEAEKQIEETVKSSEQQIDETVQSPEEKMDETVKSSVQQIDETVQSPEEKMDKTVKSSEQQIDETVQSPEEKMDETVKSSEQQIDETVKSPDQQIDENRVDETVKSSEEQIDKTVKSSEQQIEEKRVEETVKSPDNDEIKVFNVPSFLELKDLPQKNVKQHFFLNNPSSKVPTLASFALVTTLGAFLIFIIRNPRLVYGTHRHLA